MEDYVRLIDGDFKLEDLEIMGRKARLKRERKESQIRPFKEMAEQIYASGDSILDENLNPIEGMTVEDIEKKMEEAAQKQDLEKIQRNIEAFKANNDLLRSENN